MNGQQRESFSPYRKGFAATATFCLVQVVSSPKTQVWELAVGLKQKQDQPFGYFWWSVFFHLWGWSSRTRLESSLYSLSRSPSSFNGQHRGKVAFPVKILGLYTKYQSWSTFVLPFRQQLISQPAKNPLPAWHSTEKSAQIISCRFTGISQQSTSLLRAGPLAISFCVHCE